VPKYRHASLNQLVNSFANNSFAKLHSNQGDEST